MRAVDKCELSEHFHNYTFIVPVHNYETKAFFFEKMPSEKENTSVSAVCIGPKLWPKMDTNLKSASACSFGNIAKTSCSVVGTPVKF